MIILAHKQTHIQLLSGSGEYKNIKFNIIAMFQLRL